MSEPTDLDHAFASLAAACDYLERHQCGPCGVAEVHGNLLQSIEVFAEALGLTVDDAIAGANRAVLSQLAQIQAQEAAKNGDLN